MCNNECNTKESEPPYAAYDCSTDCEILHKAVLISFIKIHDFDLAELIRASVSHIVLFDNSYAVRFLHGCVEKADKIYLSFITDIIICSVYLYLVKCGAVFKNEYIVV